MRKLTLDFHPLSALVGALGLAASINLLGTVGFVQHGVTPVSIRGPLKVQGIPTPSELIRVILDSDSSEGLLGSVSSYVVPPGKQFVVTGINLGSPGPMYFLIDGSPVPYIQGGGGLPLLVVPAGSTITEAVLVSPDFLSLSGWLEDV